RRATTTTASALASRPEAAGDGRRGVAAVRGRAGRVHIHQMELQAGLARTGRLHESASHSWTRAQERIRAPVSSLASGGFRRWPHGYPSAAKTQPTVRKRMSKPPPTTRRRSGTLTSPVTGTRTISRAMNLYGTNGA